MNVKYTLLTISTLLSLVSCQTNEINIFDSAATATLEMVTLNQDLSYQFNGMEIGTLRCTQKEGVVSIDLAINNFPAGQLSYYHAVQIQTGTCKSPLSPWNLGKDPDYSFCNKLSMGEIWAKPKAEDLGNIFINEAGVGNFYLQTDLYNVGSKDATDIIGKIIYIHEVAENFTQECYEGHNHNHNNKKIACGTIELVN